MAISSTSSIEMYSKFVLNLSFIQIRRCDEGCAVDAVFRSVWPFRNCALLHRVSSICGECGSVDKLEVSY